MDKVASTLPRTIAHQANAAEWEFSRKRHQAHEERLEGHKGITAPMMSGGVSSA